MGQGVMTSMAQLLAEELAVDWSKVKTEFISTRDHLSRGKIYGRTKTGSSGSVRNSQAKAAVDAMAKDWETGAWGAIESAAILTTMRGRAGRPFRHNSPSRRRCRSGLCRSGASRGGGLFRALSRTRNHGAYYTYPRIVRAIQRAAGHAGTTYHVAKGLC